MSETRVLDSEQCLEVARLVTRRERHGPEHEWFDPLGYSFQWAAPFFDLETLGCTPRLGAGPIALPEGSPWLVRPLRAPVDPEGELGRLPADTKGLALGGVDDALAARLAERFALERLVVSAGELTRRGLESLAAHRGLTHLVLDGPLDGRGLEVLGRLKELRLLVADGADLAGEDLRHLAGLEKLEVLRLGRIRATDADLAPLRGLPIEMLELPTIWLEVKGAGLRGFSRLRDLSLGSVDAAGLDALAELGTLEHLDFGYHGHADGDAGRLAALTNLRALSTPSSRDSLDWLSKLTNLRRLRLTGSRFRGPSLEPLAALAGLVELCLPDGMVQDEALAPLAALRELRALDLKSSMVTGSGLRHLAALPRLERLNLFNCISIDAAGLAEVAKLPALRVLNLGSCMSPYEEEQTKGLTDEGLSKLAACRTLRKLDVNGNRISPPAVRALRAALPECRIVAGYMVKAPFGDRMNEARDLIERGDLDAAEKILDEVVAAYPDMPGPHDVASRLFQARGDVAAEIAACTRAIEIDPEPEAFAARAVARSRAGDALGAVADHGAVLRADPSRVEFFLRRAEARFDAGDHEGAILDYTALIERCVGPGGPAGLWAQVGDAAVGNRGCARVELRRYAEAERDFDAALGIEPRGGNNWANRAEARFHLGRAREALADAERALELEPDNATALKYRLLARRALGG